MHDRGRRRPVETGNASLIGLLSLQLLLLAFFILLTSVSRFETERAHAVIASVQQAFSSLSEEAAGAFGDSGSATYALAEVERRLGDLAAAGLPITQVAVEQEPGVVRVELPADLLFRPRESAASPAGGDFLDRLMAVLGGLPSGHRYDLSVRLGSGDGNARDVARSGTLARALLTAGAPPQATAVGLTRQHAGRVAFLIRLSASSEAPGALEAAP